MLRLVSYRTDRTAPTWQAGATSNNALIDLSGYTAATSHSVAGKSYSPVRSFLSASPNEQEQILAWAARQLDEGEQLLSLERGRAGTAST